MPGSGEGLQYVISRARCGTGQQTGGIVDCSKSSSTLFQNSAKKKLQPGDDAGASPVLAKKFAW
jgi:hypothetical protein